MTLRDICIGCLLVLAAGLLATEAAAEAVQLSMTADSNTTALYLFKEGTGSTSANEVATGKPLNVGKGTWVPGRKYFALATDSASENDKSYIYVVDDPSIFPKAAITVEAWVKLRYTSGYLVCKNGIYFLTLGEGTFAAEFIVNGTAITASSLSPIPVGQWIHLAATYQRTLVSGSTTYTGTVTVYVNGAQYAQASASGLATGLISDPGYGPKFVIGNNDWSAWAHEMDGKVDSLRISNIARVFTPLYPAPSEAAIPPRAIWCPTAISRSG